MPTTSASLISCTKEKNIITCIATTSSGKNSTYIFDINKGQWTNVTLSRPLRTKPSFFNNIYTARRVFKDSLDRTNPILSTVLFDFPCSSSSIIYQTADKLESIYRNAGRLDIVRPIPKEDLENIGENWNEYVKLLNTVCPMHDIFFSSFSSLQWQQMHISMETEINKYPWVNAYQRKLVSDVIFEVIRNRYNKQYSMAYLTYWLFELSDFIAIKPSHYSDRPQYNVYIPGLFQLGRTDLVRCIKSTIEIAEQMNVKLEKKNLLKQGSHLFVQAQLSMDKAINEQLKKQADKYRDKLAFENEEFTVIIPTTQDEFQDEADQQNNCVRRLYMSKVADGRTNVVFIRKKSCLHKSYITCEISNRGNIIQYLGVNNSRDLAEDALAFKKAYIKHLDEKFRNQTLDIEF